MTVWEKNKNIANSALEAFGGKPKVVRYWDDNNKSYVDLLACVDQPQTGVVSFSTLGLSDHPVSVKGIGTSLAVELVGACGSSFTAFPNILATCSFCIINDSHACFPGTIFRDIVSMYCKSSPMRHILCVPPFLWEGKLRTLKLKSHKVAWLLALPISEAEYEYAKKKDTDKLEELFEEKQIDIFNLKRESVV